MDRYLNIKEKEVLADLIMQHYQQYDSFWSTLTTTLFPGEKLRRYNEMAQILCLRDTREVEQTLEAVAELFATTESVEECVEIIQRGAPQGKLSTAPRLKPRQVGIESLAVTAANVLGRMQCFQ